VESQKLTANTVTAITLLDSSTTMRTTSPLALPHGATDLGLRTALAPVLSQVRLLVLLAAEAVVPDGAAAEAVDAVTVTAADLFVSLDLVLVEELARGAFIVGAPAKGGRDFQAAVRHAFEVDFGLGLANQVLNVRDGPLVTAKGAWEDARGRARSEEVVVQVHVHAGAADVGKALGRARLWYLGLTNKLRGLHDAVAGQTHVWWIAGVEDVAQWLAEAASTDDGGIDVFGSVGRG